MTRNTLTIAMTAISLIVSAALPALAAPGAEYFGNVTPAGRTPADRTPAKPKPVNNIKPSAFATMSASSPALTWFEHTDDIVAKYQPSDIDRVVLNKPFNQEAERVQAWTIVAARVAKNYRALSKELKASTVPPSCPDIKDYRDMVADWYSDAAEVYEDLIKPRPPAKTQEELDRGLDEIKQRSSALANTNRQLRGMDESLRREYSVHFARATDPLWKYVHQSIK